MGAHGIKIGYREIQLLLNASGITRVVLSAGLSPAKCFILSGPLCQPGTCVAWKVSFPSSNESLMSMLSAVNCMELSGFRTVSYRTTVPFISFKNRLCLALVRCPTWGFVCRIWPALCNRSTNSVERVAWWRILPRATCFGIYLTPSLGAYIIPCMMLKTVVWWLWSLPSLSQWGIVNISSSLSVSLLW